MSHLDPKRPATIKELRQFGLLVGGAFLLLAGFLFWHHKPQAIIVGFAGVGALLVLAGLAVPHRLAKVYAGWMGFAVLLSKVTTPIFMGVVYFVVLSTTGLLMRAFGRNPLRRSNSASLWVTRPTGARRSSLIRQF